MTDNLNSTQSNTESDSSSQTQNSDHMIPKSRFDEVNTKYRETLKRLEALEAAQQEQSDSQRKQREKELAEQNRYKELYEQAQAEVESLKAVQQDAQRLRDSFQQTLAARLEAIPEERQHLVPEFDDPIKLSAWLDKALPDLVTPPRPTAPNLNGGSGSGGGSASSTGTLSSEQESLASFAQQMGYTVNRDRIAQFVKHPVSPTDLNQKKDETP